LRTIARALAQLLSVPEQASTVHHFQKQLMESFPSVCKAFFAYTIFALVDASFAVALEASIESFACSEELTILWLRWLSTRLTTRLLITVVCRLLWSCR